MVSLFWTFHLLPPFQPFIFINSTILLFWTFHLLPPLLFQLYFLFFYFPTCSLQKGQYSLSLSLPLQICFFWCIFYLLFQSLFSRSRSLRSIFLIGASICMGNSLLIDPAQCPPPSPAAFQLVGVYNGNFLTLMPDRETTSWTSNGALLWPELCKSKIPLDPCRMCLTVPHNTLTWGILTPAVPRISLIEPRPVDSLFRSSPSSAVWSGYYYRGS